MKKKHIGMALVALGAYRYYVEQVNVGGAVATGGLNAWLDYGGGPGSSGITYAILAVGGYLWYKNRG